MPPPSPPILRAIGCATPDAFVTQEEAAGALAALMPDEGSARKIRALAKRTRIATRASALGRAGDLTAFGERLLDASSPPPGTSARMDEHARVALPLALLACRRAFERDRAVAPEDVTHVLVASCTGFVAPGLDVLLARDLPLPASCGRILIGFQGCHAALSSLRLARTIACADPRALVLVACVELCTLHAQRSGSDDALVSSLLFADGAAAALVGGAGLPPPREHPPLAITRAATRLVPDTLAGMAWRVGDHGFEMSLSAYVPQLLASDARGALAAMLDLGAGEEASLFWAIHPGGAAILDALERALGLPAEALDASRAVLARHGNMSSPTVLFVIDEILRRGARGPGIALAFGPGLTIEACRLEPPA